MEREEKQNRVRQMNVIEKERKKEKKKKREFYRLCMFMVKLTHVQVVQKKVLFF